MLWSNKRIFLPSCDPIHSLPILNFDNTQLIYTLENLLSNLPSFLEDRCIREELVSQLREITQFYHHGCIDALGGQAEYERIFLIFAFFANAYVNAIHENVKPKIPKEIAIPFLRVAHLVGRQPILDYTSYCLYNWKKNGDNFEILTTFSNSIDEKLFIGAFLKMELCSIELFDSRLDLIKLKIILENLIQNFKATWDQINWDNLHEILCHFQDFKNVVYENGNLEPQCFVGNVFWQSPFIRLIYKMLNISFPEGNVADYEKNLIPLRPRDHTGLLNSVSSTRHRGNRDRKYAKIYNECLESLLELSQHVFYPIAEEDIEKNELRVSVISDHFFNNVKVV